ncbi:MAG: tetratricopeptide repeat protein [Ruminococcaceae bacterium]|nr:tetratricopeptide repeat protein [Oscillospiraceae bacterium]
MSKILKPEDYEEPVCPFCTDAYKTEKPRESVPVDRIISKLDSYFAKNDTEGAARHLAYWLSECDRVCDMRGKLSLLDEQMGLMRKMGNNEAATAAAKEALALIPRLKQENTRCHGTVLLNAATVHKAFGRNSEAIALYNEAQRILEAIGAEEALLAGLYNNKAIAHISLKEYGAAEELFNKALDIMLRTPGGECDAAITYLNTADLIVAQKGAEAGEKEIEACLDKAEELLEKINERTDGYYAFVCEKCAPVFMHYGRFLYSKELSARAEKLYERS